MFHRCALVLAMALPVPAMADEFTMVSEKDAFLDLIGDRVLRIGLYDLSLRVKPDGTIDGTAMGWTITGKWAWEDGYFCRQMDWSGTEISYNCQLVEARGADAMRFTVDQGAGQSATFRLR